MDLSLITGSFAMIVGLLSNFKAERSSTDLNDFISWVKERYNEDIAASIERDQALSSKLTQILSSNHEKLIDELSKFDLLISSIADQFKELSGLARAVHPESVFSDQAISILRQFVESGASVMMEHKIMDRSGKNDYYLMEGGHGKITYNEPRFIEDDLRILAGTGLLRFELTLKGTRRFLITRAAVSFINACN